MSPRRCHCRRCVRMRRSGTAALISQSIRRPNTVAATEDMPTPKRSHEQRLAGGVRVVVRVNAVSAPQVRTVARQPGTKLVCLELVHEQVSGPTTWAPLCRQELSGSWHYSRVALTLVLALAAPGRIQWAALRSSQSCLLPTSSSSMHPSPFSQCARVIAPVSI